MRIQKLKWIAFSVFFIGLVACKNLFPPPPEAGETLNEPIADLTAAELAAHTEGDEEFGRIFGAENGLGPVFVAQSCITCHAADGKGHPFTMLTRFGRMENGQFSHLDSIGGPQLQLFALPGFAAEQIPSSATGVTRLLAPSVTGLGYLEAVADSTLLSLQDPNDTNGDGISGTVNWVNAPDWLPVMPGKISQAGKYIGRFGKKAGAIDLVNQTTNAYVQDMGISSGYHLEDIFNPLSANFSDGVADPEVSKSTVDKVVFYLRTLKVPTPRSSEDADVSLGAMAFATAGCDKCHLPNLQTGNSLIASLSNKEIHPYTDLLLHDMGPGLDDHYTEGTAATSEWRTAPLWGIGLSEVSQGGKMYLMHDGRATTLEEAIQLHAGEAQASRDKFQLMTATEKENLIAFLRSL